MTNFYISGPGFSGAEKVKVAVNTQNVTDTGTLITAINKGIQNAGNNGTAAGTALQDANITASMNTDGSGKQQLAFSSSTTAFQVEAGDLVSNALMGNFATPGRNADASAMTSTVSVPSGGGVTLTDDAVSPSGITVRFTGGGLSAPVDITLQSSDQSVANEISDLQTQMATKLAGTGITLATPTSGNPLVFSNARGEAFAVSVSGDTANSLGFGTFQKGLNGAYDYSTLLGAAYDPTAATTAGTGTLQFSINGQASNNNQVTVDMTAGSATAAHVTSSDNSTAAVMVMPNW